MFMECFFEAQASITEDMKRSIDERKWVININNRKTAHEVSHEKYFMEKFFDAGFKLNRLHVDKNLRMRKDFSFYVRPTFVVSSYVIQ